MTEATGAGVAPGGATWVVRLRAILPGLALVLTVAAAASFVSDHYGAPTMLMALLIGMAFNHLAGAPATAPGVEFAAKRVLRLGIVLLGARITLAQIGSLGWEAVVLVCGFTALTIAAGLLIAPRLGRRGRFGLLSAGAVAICGASAALALSAVIRRDRWEGAERDTLFVVIAVTTLSTAAMIAYPILFGALELSEREIGFLIGATIHDVAQVVGAGFSVSDAAGETATITKLLRVTLLPVVLIAVLVASRNGGSGGGDAGAVRFPLFVVGFLALAGLNSAGAVPDAVAAWLDAASRACLVTAIAALGVKTSLRAMGELGARPIAIVVVETLVLLSLAVGAVVALRPV